MYAPKIIKPRFHWPTVAVTAMVCAILAVVGALTWLQLISRPPLPAQVQSQIRFPVFIPTVAVTLTSSSYKFDRPSGVLSFTGTLQDGQTITITEQATPSPFTDIPAYTNQFLQTLHEYHAFDSVQGTVHLTRPNGAGQAGVMVAKGTLLFARVAHDEPDTVWGRLFNGMTVYAP